MTTTTRSQELFDHASHYLPGGVGSGTRSPRSGWLPLPVFAREGTGAWLVDEDGNRYIDYVMGQGPLILGHRPQAVIEAVTSTLTERGSLFSLAHDLEGEAARTVCERLPSVDLVRFSSSGTEAAMYALRFARAFTGRQLIVRFEGHYHGWSDAIHWSAHPSPDTWGEPDAPIRAARVDRDSGRHRVNPAGRTVERHRGAGSAVPAARRADRGGHHRTDPG